MKLTSLFRLVGLTFLLISIIPGLSGELKAASSDDYTFMLSPQLVELELLPGEKKRFSVSLINESKTKKALFTVYVSDLAEKRSGKYKVVKPGTSPYSAASWIMVSPTDFAIGPSDGMEILAEVTVPRGVKGGRYAVIVFELAPEGPSKEEKFGSVIFHHRMTTAVEISIKGRRAKRRAVISSLKVVSAQEDKRLAKFGKDVMMFTASLKNEGNIHIFGEGTLTIRSKKRRRIRQVPLGGGRGTVLPDTTVDFRSVLRRLPPGDYVAEAVIRYEGLRPAKAKLPFTVTEEEVPVTKAKSFQRTREVNFGVEPELIELTAPSGALRRTGIVVYSRDDREISVKSYPRALKYNRYGELMRLSSVKGAYSCGEWITVSPSSFKLSPGGKKRLSVLVNVPEGKVGGHYANIVFDAGLGGNNPGTSQKTSSNVLFFLTIPGPLKEQARIVETRVLHQDESGYRKFVVSFKNTGNIHLKPGGGKILVKRAVEIEKTGEIEYVGEPVYEEVEEIAFNRVDGVVLPGGTRDLTAVCNNELPDGDYSVEAEIDYGDKKKAVGKRTFSVAGVEREMEKERGNIFKNIYEKTKQLIKEIVKKDKDGEAK